MSPRSTDIVIVGGGIIGVATARQLVKSFPRYKVLLLEKESSLGFHQTGHNSGVIHSGIYYHPGSLKAQLCVAGAQRLMEFADQHGIYYKLCGKTIVATNPEQVPALHTLLERGKTNGVPGLKLLTAEQIKELEPNASAISGIYSPKTGIIDYLKVIQIMSEHFVKSGGEIHLINEVRLIKRSNQHYVLLTDRQEIETKFVINCGGLHSDRIARMMGFEPKVRIIPFRGEYYRLRNEKQEVVKNLLYPVPNPEMPFLGVHFTRTLDGALKVGPNAVLAFSREGYQRRALKWRDFYELLSSSYFWKLAFRYWKTGMMELSRAWNKNNFLKAAQQLVPSIEERDFVEGPTGVRAQCVDQQGYLVDDFRIIANANSIQVLNVPSPAATASLTIADYIVKLSANHLQLRP